MYAWHICSSNQVLYSPIFMAAIRQVPPDDQRDTVLTELQFSNLNRICLAARFNQWWSIHAVRGSERAVAAPASVDESDYGVDWRRQYKAESTYLSCNARVPMTLARSYLVMYLLVLRSTMSKAGPAMSSGRI